jgi:DNA-directed RNA polymerase sigma subunit (sigma70/sigma32)
MDQQVWASPAAEEDGYRDQVSAEEDGYRDQVSRFPRLSHAEESRLLAVRGSAKDAANRKLIEHNLYLVFQAAQERKERGVPFGDLFQEGTVGLISAVEHYERTRGPFAEVLQRAITATMDDVLAQTADAQRNDEAFVSACRVLEMAERLLTTRLQRRPTQQEISQLLHWEEGRVQAIQGILQDARTAHDEEVLEVLQILDDEPEADR